MAAPRGVRLRRPKSRSPCIHAGRSPIDLGYGDSNSAQLCSESTTDFALFGNRWVRKTLYHRLRSAYVESKNNKAQPGRLG